MKQKHKKKSVLKGQEKRERRPTEPEGNPTISFDLNWHQKQGNDENNRNKKDLSLAGVLEAGIEKGNPKRMKRKGKERVKKKTNSNDGGLRVWERGGRTRNRLEERARTPRHSLEATASSDARVEDRGIVWKRGSAHLIIHFGPSDLELLSSSIHLGPLLDETLRRPSDLEEATYMPAKFVINTVEFLQGGTEGNETAEWTKII